MSSVAIPPVTIAPVPVTVHSKEDAIFNRLQAKMAAAATPVPAAQTPPQVPVAAPLASQQQAAPAADQTLPQVEPAAASLEELDFDAPLPEKPVEAVPAGPDTPASTPDTQIESELTKLLADGAIPEKIEEVFLKHSRGRQMLGAFKTLRDLGKPPEADGSGGIGRVPTIDEIKQADVAFRETQMMRHEIQNAPDSFARNMFGIDPETGRSWLGDPQQIHAVAAQIPQVLLQGVQQNPQVYAPIMAAVSGPFLMQLLNHQYAVALSIPEENEDRYRLLDACRIFESKIVGNVRALPQRDATGRVHAPNGRFMNSPETDQELQALRRRNQQYEQQFAQQQRSNYTSALGTVETTAKAGAMEDIDKALDFRGVKQIYSEMVLGPQRDAIYNEIHGSMERSNPTGWAHYRMQLEQAGRGQIAADQPAQTYRNLFRNALKSDLRVTERLNELVKSGRQASQDRVNAQTQAQLRTGPNGSQPAPSSVLPSQQIVRQPGESQEDFITRRVSAKMIKR